MSGLSELADVIKAAENAVEALESHPATIETIPPEILRQAIADRLRAAWPKACVGWMIGSIHNSAVSHQTDAYNHLGAVLPALLEHILREI